MIRKAISILSSIFRNTFFSYIKRLQKRNQTNDVDIIPAQFSNFFASMGLEME